MSGDLPVDFAWIFNGNAIARRNVQGIKIETRKRGSTLSIESVQGYHSGNYTCQARNQADTVAATIDLAVKGLSTTIMHNNTLTIQTSKTSHKQPFLPVSYIPELPEIEPFSFSAHGFNSGSSAKTMCTVTSGDSPIDLYWMKDGRKLDASIIRRIDEYSSIVSIRLVTISDAGNYTCVAKNGAGMAQFTSPLVVKGGLTSVSV